MYRQITSGERYTLGALHTQGPQPSRDRRQLGRHRSTIGRELKRNRTRYDGAYRPLKANEYTNGRRSRSRRNRQFGPVQFQLVEGLLRRQWSPEQVSGYLRRERLLEISYETIYLHVCETRPKGGFYGSTCAVRSSTDASAIEPTTAAAAWRARSDFGATAVVEARKQIGHWEMDTVIGHASQRLHPQPGGAGERLFAHWQAARSH